VSDVHRFPQSGPSATRKKDVRAVAAEDTPEEVPHTHPLRTAGEEALHTPVAGDTRRTPVVHHIPAVHRNQVVRRAERSNLLVAVEDRRNLGRAGFGSTTRDR
jgi:hypothetical protein